MATFLYKTKDESLKLDHKFQRNRCTCIKIPIELRTFEVG